MGDDGPPNATRADDLSIIKLLTAQKKIRRRRRCCCDTPRGEHRDPVDGSTAEDSTPTALSVSRPVAADAVVRRRATGKRARGRRNGRSAAVGGRGGRRRRTNRRTTRRGPRADGPGGGGGGGCPAATNARRLRVPRGPQRVLNAGAPHQCCCVGIVRGP